LSRRVQLYTNPVELDVKAVMERRSQIKHNLETLKQELDQIDQQLYDLGLKAIN
jgi:hypothetical protein